MQDVTFVARRVTWAIVGCVLLAIAGFAQGSETRVLPNVIVFLVDDMGWQDTSVPFHTEVTPINQLFRTPNMQRLADAGVKFTQAYAHAICSPTRVSLMTGLNPARHRVTNWTLSRNASNDRAHAHLDPPTWNMNGLSPEPGIEGTVHARSLPAYLQDVGYRTIHVGKAHFGATGTPGEDPLNVGFDINIGGHAAGGPGSFYGLDHFSASRREVYRVDDPRWDVPGLKKYHGEEIYLTEALTREAIEAMRGAVDEGVPFFLHMSHYAVHAPLMPDPRYIENYQNRHPAEAAYASMIEGMDESLGDLLDALEAMGVADDTVVLFVSDNGGVSHAARGGDKFTHNLPLSAGKGSAREGGTRVPMIVAWPGVVAPGTSTSTPVIIEDFFPTVLEIAGIGEVSQVGDAIDGVSFVDILRGDAKDRAARPLIWHVPNNWTGDYDPGYGPHSTIRVGDWKLIYYHSPHRKDRFELFNLAEDLSEEHNLASTHPEQVQQLAQRLQHELMSRDASMPVNRATGAPVKMPAEALE